MNRKKRWATALLAAICLCLVGCAMPTPPPASAADGTPWDPDWETVGGLIGVDAPEKLTLAENRDTLTINAMCYASWSMGEAEPYKTQSGDDTYLFDAQIHLLVQQTESEEAAQAVVAQWIGMSQEMYTVLDTAEETHAGQDFSTVTCTYEAGRTPYEAGASAFGSFGSRAVSIEIVCRGEAAADPHALLAEFLDCLHYAP